MPPALTYILSISDLYLTPIYIFILFLVVKKLKKKYYADSPLKSIILPAFFIHIMGSICFALIYQNFYGYGDTFNYFTGARETWEAFIKNPKVAFELIFVKTGNFSQAALDAAPFTSYAGFAPSTSAIIKIAGFTSLFCFGSYLPIAIIFSLFSLWGTWLIYVTINEYFPHLYKFTAVACLFIPSVIIWSSGLTKEAPCMFALGLCFYSMNKLLHRTGFIKYVLYFVLGTIILLVIKSYIFFTFAIAAVVWTYRFFILVIKDIFRIIVRALLFMAFFSVLIYFITVPENTLQQTILQGISSGEHLQELMTTINEYSGGSGYTLPPVNLSVWGILQSFLLSANVALFRPYAWECSNVLMVMNFLESFGTLIVVLVVLFKAGIGKLFSYCNHYPVLYFMLVFSVLFAPLVGFISFNFGTLARYKIPFLPFFFAFLLILLFDKTLQPKPSKI